MVNKEQNIIQKVFTGEKGRKLLEEIIKAIKEISYGYIQITIHNSKVVQIDKTEKMRW